MSNLKTYLQKLNNNLYTLREREAKHAGNAPLDLLNQISDHEQAIALTKQTIAGELTETEWDQALKPLLVSLNQNQPAINQQNQHVGTQINVMGNIQIERFVDRNIELIDERKKKVDNLFANFVEPIYASFEEIHRHYLESFKHYRHLLTNHEVALPTLIDTVREQYLFTEGQRAKLRKLRNVADHQFYPFFSAMHAYLTATYDDGSGPDQRWYRGFLGHLDEIQNFVQYRQHAQPTAMAANWREKRYQEIGQVYDHSVENMSDSNALEALRGELSSQSTSVSWVEGYCDLNGTDWPPHQAAAAVLDELVRNLQDVYATVGEEYWKLKIRMLNG
jgi:hypothetical protein